MEQIESVYKSSSPSVQASVFRKVYTWMTFALVISGLTSLFVASSPSLVGSIFGNSFLFWGILIAELALVWILSSSIGRLSLVSATTMFIVYSLLNGITLSMIFVFYTASSIASAFFVTAGTFAVMAVYGTVTKRDLSSWGNIFFMALIGLIIASVVNIFLKSSVLDWIVTFAGVIIFVGLTAWDVQKIKQISREFTEENESTQKIALMGALSLYLDFVNLFLYILRIFGRRN